MSSSEARDNQHCVYIDLFKSRWDVDGIFVFSFSVKMAVRFLWICKFYVYGINSVWISIKMKVRIPHGSGHNETLPAVLRIRIRRIRMFWGPSLIWIH